MTAQATHPDIETQDQAHHHKLVEVFLELTDEDGNAESKTLEIPRGETPVPTLKQELGLIETDPLWVIKKDGERKPLGDHEKHDVKEGDRYQAIVKGGIS
jgi:hypothetical protein